jgi:hypothetical protein
VPPAGALQPLITDDTATQGAAGNQAELALNRLEAKSLGVTTTITSAPFVYTRGITDVLDAYAGISYGRITSSDRGAAARGPGNPLLGLKWRFYANDARRFSLGFKPEVFFGTSHEDEARGLGIGRTGFSGVLMLTQEATFGALHVNYGYTRASYALESNRSSLRSNLHRLSMAPVFDIGARWKLAVDAGTTTNPERSARATMGYAELGAIWSPGKDLDFALGAIAFRGDGEPRTFTLTAGVTWRFR